MKGGSSLLIFNFWRVWEERRSTNGEGERNCLSCLSSKEKSRTPALSKTYLFILVVFPVLNLVSLFYEVVSQSVFYPPQFILFVLCHCNWYICRWQHLNWNTQNVSGNLSIYWSSTPFHHCEQFPETENNFVSYSVGGLSFLTLLNSLHLHFLVKYINQ